jgi:hypothetical protein
MRHLKWIMLAIYLILIGLSLIGIGLGGIPLDAVAGICALIAGIMFLIWR